MNIDAVLEMFVWFIGVQLQVEFLLPHRFDVLQELIKILKGLKKQGKRIHIYGASTKGNTILQWCGIDNRLVDVAAERNPDKYGARTLGTDIPIVSEAESRAMNPDYYLVLPWHFKEEFVRRESETLSRGIGLIFPLPNIEIVHKTTEKH